MLELGAFHSETLYVVSYKFNKPRFRLAGKFPKLLAPSETHSAGVEGVVFKNQSRALRVRQAVLDERQIQILVTAVKFVADDGVADVREVNADLMFTPGSRNDSQQSEWSAGLRHGGLEFTL